MFSVQAIGDGLPELQESFTLSLVAVEGAGRIVDPRVARIAIQSSDDPAGVLSLEDIPGGLTIDEGDTISVRVLRSAGSHGTVTVTWAIQPPQADLFNPVTDTLVLLTGQTETTFSIQVTDGTGA